MIKSVVWNEMPVKYLNENVSSVEVPINTVIDQIPQRKSEDFSDVISVSVNDRYISMDIKDVLGDFYKPWVSMSYYGEANEVRTICKKFNELRNNPRFNIELLRTEDGKDVVLSKTNCMGSEKPSKLIEHLSRLNVDTIQDKFPNVRVGSDGNNLELQFIREDAGVKSAEDGDILKPCIFVRMNKWSPKLSISPGVYRLVCTNGLIRSMFFWKNTNMDFLNSESILKNAMDYVDWFISMKDRKVGSTRELAVILKRHLSERLLDSYWGEWAEKIDMRALTYYDVINDMTSTVNNTLTDIRYTTMNIGEKIESYLASEHRCPVCMAKIDEE